ncbi:nucleotide-binding universal stress UspA family protein [Paraburkholderia caballeronis]|nr:nucleotide-binding universal stress UspA family protein [Paraburkholderia caballeronis]
MFTHILVPTVARTDDSDLSKKAIDGAIDLARTVGARVTAYACVSPYPYSPYSAAAIEPPGDFDARSERDARAHLRRIEDAARDAGVVCSSRTSVHPSPYLGVVEAAEDGGCDVIFMASRGPRRPGSLLIGSETQRVLTHTKLPVIVYRQERPRPTRGRSCCRCAGRGGSPRLGLVGVACAGLLPVRGLAP